MQNSKCRIGIIRAIRDISVIGAINIIGKTIKLIMPITPITPTPTPQKTDLEESSKPVLII
jgi:hypothetical protein